MKPSRQLARPKGKPRLGGPTGALAHTRAARLRARAAASYPECERDKALVCVGVNGRGQRKSPGPLDGNGRGFDAGSLVVDSLRSRRGYPYTGTLTKGSSLCVPLLESSFFFCLFGQPDPALSHFQHERLVTRIVRALPLRAADRHAFGEAGEYLGL